MSDRDPFEHEVTLRLASGAIVKLLYFSDREQRWIFSYDYRSAHSPGEVPEIINDVRLTAEYADGLLTSTLVLSMHVVIPSRLGQQYFAGVDISPGAKTYLEFTYERSGTEYRLVEICKGARDRVRLDDVQPAIVRPIAFSFPVPDRISIEHGSLRVPFLGNDGAVAHFELPERTLRA